MQRLRHVLISHSSLSAAEVANATTAEELRALWGTRLTSKDPELTLEQFKQFIVVLTVQQHSDSYSYITPADAGKMAVEAFQLLDTDQSETISFKEVEVRALSSEHAANTQHCKYLHLPILHNKPLIVLCLPHRIFGVFTKCSSFCTATAFCARNWCWSNASARSHYLMPKPLSRLEH